MAGTPAPAQTTTAKQVPVPEPVIDRTPEPVVATLVLAAGMTRSEGAPATLKLPPKADTLRIEIGLEPGDDEYGSYRAVVQTVGGKVVEERTGLAANDGRLQIDLPASPFGPGEYEVLVEAVGDGGAEPLGAWPFVIR